MRNHEPSQPRRTEPADVFPTVLVANRGEIARRVMRTLTTLGIRSVAVYSDADADAPHVREADAAYRIGPAPATESYLDAAAILEAARLSGAAAIHPGYGFLSENVAFARACAQAGIVFIGPGERALEVMGDKIRSKAHVADSGVPVVPGIDASGLTDAQIADAASAMGYPLLVKPSAGGGGKGMQIVREASGLSDALGAARRIAAASFGDDTLLLERLIERPRHIEVQVVGGADGSVIHLGERECTLQRRHQKVIEEAPSPVVDADTRARLGAAACAAAASVDYRGAGTVEFLVAADRPDEFFFIEMNTRLQVEHPVTEQVTGLDLVELQLRVAAGLPLGITQHDVRLTGHAIEARVYAESPERGFLPATGDVLAWVAAEGDGVRVDSAVETGSSITADYDPMIAKVIAWGADRAGALRTLDEALASTAALGVDTNVAFLRTLLAEPAVQSGDLDTGLIDRMPPPRVHAPSAAARDVAAGAVAAGAVAAAAVAAGAKECGPRGTSASPLWTTGSGWRLGGAPVTCAQAFEADDGTVHLASPPTPPGSPAPSARVGDEMRAQGAGELRDRAASTTAHSSGAPCARVSDQMRAQGAGEQGGARAARAVIDADGAVWVHADGAAHRLRPLSRRESLQKRLADAGAAASTTSPDLRAPMPGTVVAVHVRDGARVAAGERIASIEAMKMEHAVVAPHDGIARLLVKIGDQVRRDHVLAHVEPDPHETATAP